MTVASGIPYVRRAEHGVKRIAARIRNQLGVELAQRRDLRAVL